MSSASARAGTPGARRCILHDNFERELAGGRSRAYPLRRFDPGSRAGHGNSEDELGWTVFGEREGAGLRSGQGVGERETDPGAAVAADATLEDVSRDLRRHPWALVAHPQPHT